MQILPVRSGAFEDGAETVRDHVLDLIALSVATSQAKTLPSLSSRHAIALLKLREAIDARLQDDELTPAIAAAAAGISVRYANALLAPHGTSRAPYSDAASRTLPQGAGRPGPAAPHPVRNCLRVGLLKPVAFYAGVHESLRHEPSRISHAPTGGRISALDR